MGENDVFPDLRQIFSPVRHFSCWRFVFLHSEKTNDMEASFIIAVALGVAIVVVLLVLVAVIVYQRWRISDNNVHLEKFINENMEMRQKLRKAGMY